MYAYSCRAANDIQIKISYIFIQMYSVTTSTFILWLAERMGKMKQILATHVVKMKLSCLFGIAHYPHAVVHSSSIQTFFSELRIYQLSVVLIMKNDAINIDAIVTL